MRDVAKLTTTVTLMRSQSEPEIMATIETGVPALVDIDPAIAQVPRLLAKSENCIYCGSYDTLSDEHPLPLALGGTSIIREGSCEVCRRKTKFEQRVLRGPIRFVRFVQNMPSRSGHRDTPKTIPMRLTIDGVEVSMAVPVSEAPILFSLPLFPLPAALRESDDERLELLGHQPIQFGVDPETFLRSHNATSLYYESAGHAPIEFAQMIAKIAYAAAWAGGLIEDIADPYDLPQRFLDAPETLGSVVGTLGKV